MTLRTNESPIFDFHDAAVKEKQFVRHKFHIPAISKLHFIHNEKARIYERYSRREDFLKHDKDFNEVLRANDYPNTIIKKAGNMKRRPNLTSTADMECLYFPFP